MILFALLWAGTSTIAAFDWASRVAHWKYPASVNECCSLTAAAVSLGVFFICGTAIDIRHEIKKRA